MSTSQLAPTLRTRIKTQLLDRRTRLEKAIATLKEPTDLVRLLDEVDSALDRVDTESYGVCEVCLTPVENADLLANPMARYCLCEMSPERRRGLERDLELAWQVQAALLPPVNLDVPGWRTHYRYVPHGAVSGDYCDLIAVDGDDSCLYFMLGDVSGKGIAASLLMAHLNASLRTLAQSGLSPEDMIRKTDSLLAASTLASHYATLICGRAFPSGRVDLVNAGHCEPVVVRSHGDVEKLSGGGLPLGMTVPRDTVQGLTAHHVDLTDGDSLLLYTDGFVEACDEDDRDYGGERLAAVLRQHAGCGPQDIVRECLADLHTFLKGGQSHDDLTVLALCRQGIA